MKSIIFSILFILAGTAEARFFYSSKGTVKLKYYNGHKTKTIKSSSATLSVSDDEESCSLAIKSRIYDCDVKTFSNYLSTISLSFNEEETEDMVRDLNNRAKKSKQVKENVLDDAEYTNHYFNRYLADSYSTYGNEFYGENNKVKFINQFDSFSTRTLYIEFKGKNKLKNKY